MTRCNQCNALLTKTEKVCAGCGASCSSPEESKASARKRFAAVINLLFFASLALTVAAIFVPYTPSVAKCFQITVVLFIVRSSAGEMAAGAK
jgi:hypothetical protein